MAARIAEIVHPATLAQVKLFPRVGSARAHLDLAGDDGTGLEHDLASDRERTRVDARGAG